MPVILDGGDYDTWLTGSPDAASKLLKPFPAGQMQIAMEGGKSDPPDLILFSYYVLMPECGMADPANLIVVMVYDADPETGLPFVVGEPMQFDTSEKAIRVAQRLADKHAGVIA